MRRILSSILLAASLSLPLFAAGKTPAGGPTGESVYKLRPADPVAMYFDADKSGKTDVSQALQDAINTLKKQQTAGILFIPEGNYLISKTIYIPTSIRLIGYGTNRPTFLLKDRTFTTPANEDHSGYPGMGHLPEAHYMFFFTGNLVEGDTQPSDANAGTFYSAWSNINIRIGKGNPYAAGIRSHFAQHGFINHADFQIGDGLAGIIEVGNESEDLRFFGGQYGIVASNTSPSWPMIGVDYYFEGQRSAAIKSFGSSIYTIVNMTVRDVPTAVDCSQVSERLYLENCRFESVRDAAIKIGNPDSELSQFNLIDIYCKDVPVFAASDVEVLRKAPARTYKVADFTFGILQKSFADAPQHDFVCEAVPCAWPVSAPKIIPMLPEMSSWVSVRDYGAKGDGIADDTEAIRAAMAAGDNVYFPCGVYRVTSTVKMRPGVKFIGLHTFATQLFLEESEPAFSGFGTPVPVLESSEGGVNFLNGIGINTGGMNYRAVGVKWMAGEGSYMNDVKYIGGHGTLQLGPMVQRSYSFYNNRVSSPKNAVAASGKDLAWDNQFWSLWITNGGGGIIKDIWSASTYATSGIYISNTSTPTSLFCISLEHHVRSEMRMDNVHNYKIYGLQTEEESRESLECQPVDMNACSDILFANTNTFRVIRVVTPWPYAFKISNSRNIVWRGLHNYGQVKQPHNYVAYDINTGQKILPWAFAKATLTGEEPRAEYHRPAYGNVRIIETGFQFAEGLAADSKGNVYFLENLRRRIYRYNPSSGVLNLVTDIPYKPMELACDTRDNLIVIARYDPQGGYMVDGKQETVPALEDENIAWSGWGNGGWGPVAYSIDPDDPDNTFTILERVPVEKVSRLRTAYYPTSRWRYDMDRALQMVPKNYFKGVDGVTYVPETHDLTRTASLSAAQPGKTFYMSDEGRKKIIALDVDESGRLSGAKVLPISSEFGVVKGPDGLLYVAAGHIYVYSADGVLLRTIRTPERPTALQFGGPDGRTLYATTRESLLEISL